MAPWLKTKLWKPANKQSELSRDFVVGFIGGIIGTTVATPFDMLKSRMQTLRAPGTPAPYGSVIPALCQVYREEGTRTLMRGWVMRVIRLGPGGGIMLVVFDRVYNYLGTKVFGYDMPTAKSV